MKLLKFYATWCSHCKTLDNEIKDFDLVEIQSLDIDENPKLRQAYDVHSIPTLILVDDLDNELWRHTGSDITKRKLAEAINEALWHQPNLKQNMETSKPNKMRKKILWETIITIAFLVIGNRIFNHVSAWGGILIAACAAAFGINIIYQLFKTHHSQQ